MGFVKKLVGGSKPAAQPAAAPAATPAEAAITTQNDKAAAAATPEAQEEERRRRMLAINRQGPGGQMTAPGGVQGPATVFRKMLLGI